MITSDGKTILIKYLLGQAPSMASHIAVGCGPNPLGALSFSVTNVALSGTTVTLTTSAAHGFVANDSVTVKDVGPFFDGVYTVASAPSTTTLTYTIVNPITAIASISATLTTGVGVVTAVTDAVAASLYVGQEIQKVSGAGTYASNPIILSIKQITTNSNTLTISVPNTGTTGSVVFQSNAVMNIGVSPVGTVAKNYTQKKTLDMEMFRLPIESRGYIVENNISKMVFSAKLPQEERYEITELGIWSAGSNPSAGAYGSKNVFNFSANETWAYYDGSLKVTLAPPSDTSLDVGGNQTISTTTYAVPTRINSDNSIFSNTNRLTRYERCRYLGTNIMVPGNWSTYTGSALSGKYLIYDNFNIDMSQAMPNDELRLAFSVINSASGTTNPGSNQNAYVTLEFVDSNTNTCRFYFAATPTQLGVSRYNVSTRTISQGYTSSSAFSWENITTVKIYAAVSNTTANGTDNSFFICLDSLRFENRTVDNPLYKLVAYTPIASSTIATTSGTLVKDTATVNSIQFKMGVTV